MRAREGTGASCAGLQLQRGLEGGRSPERFGRSCFTFGKCPPVAEWGQQRQGGRAEGNQREGLGWIQVSSPGGLGWGGREVGGMPLEIYQSKEGGSGTCKSRGALRGGQNSDNSHAGEPKKWTENQVKAL